MSNKNRWVVNDDDSTCKFPYWVAIMPHQENTKECQHYIQQVYNLASEEGICRTIKKVSIEDNQPEVLTGICYWNWPTDGSMDWENYEEQSLISYYNLAGELVTDWVSDFFNFYKKLRPDKYSNPYNKENYWRKQDENRLPIIIKHCRKAYQSSSIRGYETTLGEVYEFMLSSDVWFPRVVGWTDPEEPHYDNNEMAALNTPRLNRFLQRTKELTLNLGGKWELAGDRPVAIDDYELFENYYSYSFNPKMIDSKIIYVDGIKKEVYPSLSKYEGVENISPECQITENGISLEIDLRSRNRWCMLTDEKSEIDLPKWTAHFPAGKFATHQDFWPLVKTILEVGQQEEIFRIFTEEAEFRRFIRDVDSSILPMPFLEVLHSGISGTKVEEQLVADNLPEYIRNIQGMTKVSYYEKDGQLVDKYVGERGLGKFLYNYHLGDLGKYQCEYGKRFLHAYYGCLRFYDCLVPEYEPEGCYINIKLTSDIWFPIVDGSVERKVGIDTSFDTDEIAYYTGGFDNRELANRHTPRLNRFLSAIAEKVIEMGGEWSLGPYVDPKYLKKMTLTGIKMDV
jgi:hypothetical protein